MPNPQDTDLQMELSIPFLPIKPSQPLCLGTRSTSSQRDCCPSLLVKDGQLQTSFPRRLHQSWLNSYKALNFLLRRSGDLWGHTKLPPAHWSMYCSTGRFPCSSDVLGTVLCKIPVSLRWTQLCWSHDVCCRIKRLMAKSSAVSIDYREFNLILFKSTKKRVFLRLI